jgi:hypothetical protein
VAPLAKVVLAQLPTSGMVSPMIGQFGRFSSRVTLMSKTLPHQGLVQTCLWVACWILCAGAVNGAEPEVTAKHTREFRILVDGKHRGNQANRKS